MNINDVRNIINYISNKYQEGNLSGEEFNYIINQGSRNYYSFLLGDEQQYAPGRPVPRIGLGLSETVRTKVRPMMLSATPAVTAGVVADPTDFLRLDAIRTTAGKMMRYVEPDRLGNYLSNVIDPVADNPIYVPASNGWTVYPNTLAQVQMDYLIDVPLGVWGYTSVGGREVYDAASSTDLVWDDNSMTDVMGRAIKLMGINLKDGELLSYAQSVIATGE